MENFIGEFAPHFEEIYIKEPLYDEDTDAESPATYEEWSDNQSVSQISPAWPVNVDDSDSDSQEITFIEELFKCKVAGENDARKMPVPIEFPMLKKAFGADGNLEDPRAMHMKVEPLTIEFPMIKEEPSSDLQTAETIPGGDSDEDCIIIEENDCPQDSLAQASEIVADTNKGPPVVVVGVTEGTSSGAPIMLEPESRKMIQHHLILLLHANWCQSRETPVNEECTLPHCKRMKALLEHMKTCQLGKSCTKRLCSSSHVVIAHWIECTNSCCAVCAPIVQAEEIKLQQNGLQLVDMRVFEGFPHGDQTIPDPKTKLMQHHLKHLLHANQCQIRECLNKEVLSQCSRPFCREMRNLLVHMMACQSGRSCSVRFCFSSHDVITHWIHCTNPICTLCAPVRQTEKQESQRDGTLPREVSQLVSQAAISSGPAPSFAAKDLRPIHTQLVLLLHAQRCKFQIQTNGQIWQCVLPLCRKTKILLSHMATCNAGKSCTMPFCLLSCRIITHWASCMSSECRLCLPYLALKQSENLQFQQNVVANQAPNSSPSSTTQPFLRIMAPVSNVGEGSTLLDTPGLASSRSQVANQAPNCSPNSSTQPFIRIMAPVSNVGEGSKLLDTPGLTSSRSQVVNQAPNSSPRSTTQAPIKMAAPVHNVGESCTLLDTPGLTSSHSQDVSQEKLLKMMPFVCGMCSKRFTNNTDLYFHQGKNHIGNSFLCNICDLSFHCHTYYAKHYALHSRHKTHSSLTSGKPYSIERRPTSHNRLYSATALAGHSDTRISSLSTTATAVLNSRPSDATFVPRSSYTTTI